MSLLKEWEELTNNQTKETFQDFWKEYSEGETTIYTDLLGKYPAKLEGNIGECCEKYKVKPVIFIGFLDGIQSSLKKPFKIDDMDESSDFSLDVDYEKLYYNMHEAEADYLYSIPAWANILSEEEMEAIVKKYKRSKTVVKGAKIGRNDPCPCGSGKKYKHCCMNKDN